MSLEAGIISALISAAAALFAVILANNYAASNSRIEKMWDLRRVAYSVILSNLAEVERVLDYAIDYIADDPQHYFTGPDSARHSEIIRAHMNIVQDRFRNDYLILSIKFIELFQSMNEDISADNPNEGPDDSHDRFDEAIRNGRQLLLRQALKEIGVEAGVLPSTMPP